MRYLILLVLAVGVLAGCSPAGPPAQAPTYSQRLQAEAPLSLLSPAPGGGHIVTVHDTSHLPPNSVGLYPSGCHSPADGTPDLRCTPGAVRDDVTPATIDRTICVKGWTATVRPPSSETSKLKPVTMRAYGVTAPISDVELDHEVPIELGGASVNANLWPEVTDQGHGFNNDKDKAENNAKTLVCKHAITLAQAQQQIVSDWRSLLPHP